MNWNRLDDEWVAEETGGIYRIKGAVGFLVASRDSNESIFCLLTGIVSIQLYDYDVIHKNIIHTTEHGERIYFV